VHLVLLLPNIFILVHAAGESYVGREQLIDLNNLLKKPKSMI